MDSEEPKDTNSETLKNQIKCPDCQKEYPKPRPGVYRCTDCLCKFSLDNNHAMKIIPFFDEMSLSPLLAMLFVLGVVLLAAMGDKMMSFYERLNLFILIAVVVIGSFKGINWLCRHYRRVDRFFRRGVRPPHQADLSSLIKIDHDKENR